MEILLYMSSGLLLGWTLGANDAANVFGTAVGSRMIHFGAAAFICSVFLVLGAVVSGAGAAHGLGDLGAVNALAGSFTVALAAALTVYGMTKARLPVSITQAIVGAIVGWNLFSHSITDTDTLSTIVATWVACPILGGVIAVLLYKLTATILSRVKIHLLRLDQYTRWGLILAGAAGSYSLGANNIGNVMGVFIPSSPFSDVRVGDLFTLTSVQQLFLLGAIAIAVGVYTYSERVMMTVGADIMPLTPLAAWVVVVAHALVLFMFSSTSLEHFLLRMGLPTIPLIPVSSSQAVVGAVLGLGLLRGLKGSHQVRWRVIVNITSGWISTPIIAALSCFFLLFFMKNVFQQQVYHDVHHVLSSPVLERLESAGIETGALLDLRDERIAHGIDFRDAIRERVQLTHEQEEFVIYTATIYPLVVERSKLEKLSRHNLTSSRFDALKALEGRTFQHKWQFHEALGEQSDEWKSRPETPLNKAYNAKQEELLDYIFRTFHDETSG
jgi:PiT family inorganic phosphate transporter